MSSSEGREDRKNVVVVGMAQDDDIASAASNRYICPVGGDVERCGSSRTNASECLVETK